MCVNSKNLGLSIAITAAFLWSLYSFGVLILNLLGVAFSDMASSEAFHSFDWSGYLKNYLAQMFLIFGATGFVGWLVAEIYNDLNEIFDKTLE